MTTPFEPPPGPFDGIRPVADEWHGSFPEPRPYTYPVGGTGHLGCCALCAVRFGTHLPRRSRLMHEVG